MDLFKDFCKGSWLWEKLHEVAYAYSYLMEQYVEIEKILDVSKVSLIGSNDTTDIFKQIESYVSFKLRNVRKSLINSVIIFRV